MNFFQIILAICLLQLTTSAENQATFSAEIFDKIAQEKVNQNIVISPASIQTALALAYIGAEGNTADELRKNLHLGNSSISKVQVAEQFANLMSKIRRSTKATVKMANRIYVRNGLQLAPTFNDVAQRYFESSAERVKFYENVKTAKRINKWVEQQTEKKIKNLIQPDKINEDTAVILVNAIYFKADWVHQFHRDTKVDFHLSKINTKKVDMMHQAKHFAYAELSDLNAKALSMEYVGTDIQMLVLLPNELDGLSRLEKQLRFEDLTALIPKLKSEYVYLSLPKFKLEFDVSLKSTLEALGMQLMFNESADFSALLANGLGVAVSEVFHKGFIEVDEKGTTAAAASAVEMPELTSGIIVQNPKEFKVDHPFFFALIDSDTVYFAGHVVNI